MRDYKDSSSNREPAGTGVGAFWLIAIVGMAYFITGFIDWIVTKL